MAGDERNIYEVRHILLMAEIDVTTISSKGQVVLPVSLRKGIRTGTRFLVIRHKDSIILKRADKMDAALAEDLEFARRTGAAWEDYKKGKFTLKNKKDFLAELEKW
jgi:AbrB family looped-hinge helix DNA binding protein